MLQEFLYNCWDNCHGIYYLFCYLNVKTKHVRNATSYLENMDKIVGMTSDLKNLCFAFMFLG
jgi:hypothetical protein